MKKMDLRVGIIGSGGGASLASAIDIIIAAGYRVDPVIIVDRLCGMYYWAKKEGYYHCRLEYRSIYSFSERADNIFFDLGCKNVLLLYSRKVGRPLLDNKGVWNIHPSILPMFRGLNAVQRALESGVKIIGATLHIATEDLDSGHIVSQVAAPLSPDMSVQEANRVSFIQKVWLILNWFEVIRGVARDIPVIQEDCVYVGIASSDIVDSKLKREFLTWVKKVEDGSQEE